MRQRTGTEAACTPREWERQWCYTQSMGARGYCNHLRCICTGAEVSFPDEGVLRDWEERFHITLNSGVLCIGHVGN
jgi:hypothetical protein